MADQLAQPLPDETKRLLQALSSSLGKSESDIISKAVSQYADSIGVMADDPMDTRWKETLLSLAGLWKDRTDLPDFDELRRSADRDVWGEKDK